MELVKASVEQHWVIASEFLLQTVYRCNKRNLPLWTHEQVQVASLRKSYSLDSLYLLEHNSQLVGCVFISFDFDDFWKEIETKGTLFFHKLAIGDRFSSQGLGVLAIAEIRSFAEKSGCEWIRCDCHGGRESLRAFYENCGFAFVDRLQMYGFDVARYEMLTNC